MGFALWIDNEVAWAQGVHEYRPMGTAVIARTDLFSSRDFSPRRPGRSRLDPQYAGLFASLGDLNRFLKKIRSPVIQKKFRRSYTAVIA
jgi:hypothetical protein